MFCEKDGSVDVEFWRGSFIWGRSCGGFEWRRGALTPFPVLEGIVGDQRGPWIPL